MATYLGVDGIVKVGGTAVAETRSWNAELSAAMVETTAKGDSGRSRKKGLVDMSGSLSAAWDGDDTPQAAMTEGASVAVILYPEGDTAGNNRIYANVIISNVKIDSPLEGDCMVSFDFALRDGTIGRGTSDPS